MADILKVMESRVVRDEILKILNEAGSLGAADRTLKSVIEAINPEAVGTLANELHYLKSRGYIEDREILNKALGINRTVYFITADGVDILTGIKSDNGIEVG